MAKIVQKDNPVLRKKALEVPLEDIGSPRIAKIIKEMKFALETQKDGVAIAAPQIGENLRIFVISKRAFEIEEQNIPEEKKVSHSDIVCINPVITKISRKKALMEEGCLSVRWLYGKVNRSVKAAIQAYNENGEKFFRGGSGIFAQIFQHEIDHLDGKLFIDTARDVREIHPEQ